MLERETYNRPPNKRLLKETYRNQQNCLRSTVSLLFVKLIEVPRLSPDPEKNKTNNNI